MIHTRSRVSRSRAAHREINRNCVQRKSAASNRELAKITGYLADVRLDASWVGRRNSDNVLIGNSSYGVSVVAHWLAERVKLVVAECFGRIEAQLILFPVIQTVTIGINVRNPN